MDMEQRVQALEEEVEILKNEIQVTLLAIQEQLLNQRYPTLRGDEMTAEHSNEDDPAGKAVARSAGQAAGHSPKNPIKRVSLNPTPPTPNTPVEPDDAYSSHSDDTIVSKDWSVITRLERWASDKIDKIGAKRTRELVKLYAKQGRINAQIYAELIQFIDIYETGEPHTGHTGSRKTQEVYRTDEPPQRTTGASVPPNARVVPGNGRPTNPREQHEEERRALVMRLIDGLQGGSKSRRNY